MISPAGEAACLQSPFAPGRDLDPFGFACAGFRSTGWSRPDAPLRFSQPGFHAGAIVRVEP